MTRYWCFWYPSIWIDPDDVSKSAVYRFLSWWIHGKCILFLAVPRPTSWFNSSLAGSGKIVLKCAVMPSMSFYQSNSLSLRFSSEVIQYITTFTSTWGILKTMSPERGLAPFVFSSSFRSLGFLPRYTPSHIRKGASYLSLPHHDICVTGHREIDIRTQVRTLCIPLTSLRLGV